MSNLLNTESGASNPDVLMPAGAQPYIPARPGISTAQLRWQVLAPIMAIISVMIGTLIVVAYRHADDEIRLEVQSLHTSADEIYQDNLEHLTGMLAGISGTMVNDAKLRSALAKKDRASLSKIIAPAFTTLHKEYEITHLYLIGADRTVLLRAHDPASFGDVINRATTLEALRTKAPARGVELGAEGELNLRFVSPLYQDKAKQHLIGFLELGVNTNHLLKDIQESLGVQMFEFVSKNLLTRKAWQQGISDPARWTEWDRFPDVAPSEEALKNMTPAMSSIMSNRIFPTETAMMEVSQGKSDFRAISFPILDINERKAGRIVMLVNVTPQVSHTRNTLYLGLVLGTAGGGLLFAFFWLLTGNLGKLIEQHQEALRQMATRDGLTGLFNHIAFYTMLEDETARSQRSGTPVSLLMIDLDHFKEVNDKFGHVAGDMVLMEIGKIIQRQSRSIDRVCRYGGEEIAVILPETISAGAMIAAEHVRAAIEGHSFKLDDGGTLSITVSIGVADVPQHAASAKELVHAADQALYTAKERGRNQVYLYGS